MPEVIRRDATPEELALFLRYWNGEISAEEFKRLYRCNH